MKYFLVTCALCAAPAYAETQNPGLGQQMSAEEYDRFTIGRTLAFGRDGQEPYGVERYMSDRRVIWAFTGGDCSQGYWYPKADMICFAYEDFDTEQCWRFYNDKGRLSATFASDLDTVTQYQILDDAALFCPDFGA
ncbi:MAG: hypothetical protein JKX69_01685 [Rhodobacteraceae bacterium]|nr:hypothetical protein [Paracoccaceae bacterium]